MSCVGRSEPRGSSRRRRRTARETRAREADEGREVAVADSGGEIFPSKSGASSHQHVDLALGGAGVDDDDGISGRQTPSEKARQRLDRRERTRTAPAPGKKGNLASISGKQGARPY